MEKQTLIVKGLFLLMLSALTVLFFSVPSFAGESTKGSINNVSYSFGGFYDARALYAVNQTEDFYDLSGYPTMNTFQTINQNLELHAMISYGNAAVLTEFHLTNDYNPTGLAGSGYGTNGWSTLGYTAAPTGFNHDFNTFGLREAYFRLITPVGMWMVGRMPIKFGMGVAVNTQADGIGDMLPFDSADIGVFAGVLIGNETTSYSSYANNPTGNQYPAIATPAISPYYTHIQMGTIPTLDVVMLRPVNNFTGSLWLTEAHLNQFTSFPGPYYQPSTGSFVTSVDENIIYPTANITFGGVSATYDNGEGTVLNGELDVFKGHIICSNVAISNGECSAPTGLPVPPSSNNQYDAVSSYDLYLTGSQTINASIPLTAEFKFGIGAPIAAGHYNFTYYSMLNNTRTLFGNVLGSDWQDIQINAPGTAYIYGPALAAPLSNKWTLMLDLTENLSGGNSIEEAFIHQSWLKTNLTVPGTNYSTQMFGGSNIGNEFDLDFTHQFSKRVSLEAFGSYVWTGDGVDSIVDAPNGEPYSYSMVHKNVFALGSEVSFSF